MWLVYLKFPQIQSRIFLCYYICIFFFFCLPCLEMQHFPHSLHRFISHLLSTLLMFLFNLFNSGTLSCDNVTPVINNLHYVMIVVTHWVNVFPVWEALCAFKSFMWECLAVIRQIMCLAEPFWRHWFYVFIIFCAFFHSENSVVSLPPLVLLCSLCCS